MMQEFFYLACIRKDTMQSSSSPRNKSELQVWMNWKWSSVKLIIRMTWLWWCSVLCNVSEPLDISPVYIRCCNVKYVYVVVGGAECGVIDPPPDLWCTLIFWFYFNSAHRFKMRSNVTLLFSFFLLLLSSWRQYSCKLMSRPKITLQEEEASITVTV